MELDRSMRGHSDIENLVLKDYVTVEQWRRDESMQKGEQRDTSHMNRAISRGTIRFGCAVAGHPWFGHPGYAAGHRDLMQEASREYQ